MKRDCPKIMSLFRAGQCGGKVRGAGKLSEYIAFSPQPQGSKTPGVPIEVKQAIAG